VIEQIVTHLVIHALKHVASELGRKSSAEGDGGDDGYDSTDFDYPISPEDRESISNLLSELNTMARRELSEAGPGEFKIPGIATIKVVHIPARSAGTAKNPFTGKTVHREARAATTRIEIKVAKSLQEAINC